MAENTTDGGVKYDVAYALVTVTGGANVTNTNSAYALAHCKACTTVAVSFQLVLIVGRSKVIAPINAAGSLNYNCPACMTTALADQLVVTLTAAPSQQLLDTLTAELKQLDALPKLGAGGTPSAVASEVATVQQEIETALQNSGLEANPPSSSSASTTATPTSPSTTPAPTASTSTSSSTTPARADVDGTTRVRRPDRPVVDEHEHDPDGHEHDDDRHDDEHDKHDVDGYALRRARRPPLARQITVG